MYDVLHFCYRRLEIRPLCLPLLAFCRLYGIDRIHFQFVHIIIGSVLVHYITLEVFAKTYQETCPHHDYDGMDWSQYVVHSSSGLESDSTKRA